MKDAQQTIDSLNRENLLLRKMVEKLTKELSIELTGNIQYFLEIQEKSKKLAELVAGRITLEQNRNSMKEGFRVLAESIDAAVSVIDSSGTFLYLNQQAADLHGLSVGDIIDKNIFELLEKQEADFYMENVFNPVIKDEKEVNSIGSFISTDKNYHCEYNCRPIRGVGGEIIGLLNIVYDSLEKRKKMKITLIEQNINFIHSFSGGLEQTLSEIFSQMCQLDCIDYGGIYILNNKNQSLDLVCHYNLSLDFLSKVKSFDKQSRQFSATSKGISQYDHIGNIPPEAKGTYEKYGIYSIALIPLIHDNQINGCITIGSRKTGCINEHEKIFIESIAWRVSRIIALYEAEVKLKDTNEELNQTISDLKEKQQMLIQKSKLESLGELSAGMAHEINQPLMVISLSIENIMQKIIPGQKNLALPYLQRKLESILKNVKRIQQIIDNMRIFARDQASIIFEKVNISRAVEEALSMVSAQYRNEEINLRFNDHDKDFHVLGNHIKMESVILNLLSNSRYAVNEKESRSGLPSYQKEIRIQVSRPENLVIIEVWDNGIGIPPGNMDKLFTPFFTTKIERDGTGLGLPIVYGIVKELHGEITIESKQDEFTNVKIIVPAV